MKAQVPKIVLVPGYVSSKADGDIHYITARRLADLYCIPFEACHVWDVSSTRGQRWRPAPHDILLYPDYHGNYKPPANVQELINHWKPRKVL